MITSILTKKQTKTYGPKIYTQDGEIYKLTATVRYDDKCGNGHNSFAITGAQYRKSKNKYNEYWAEDSFGCMHEDIAKHFPQLAPYIKWHLMNSNGPMHYIANTLYHVLEHGPTHAWVEFNGGQDPLRVLKVVKGCDYIKSDFAKLVEGQPGYTVRWDEKSRKVRNLDHARSCAIWPDATNEDLTLPGLKERLEARLPKLIEEFKQAIESLGFVY